MNNIEDMGFEVVGLDQVEIANTSIDDIDAENINLMFLGIDRSGSMNSFSSDMSKALLDFKDALSNSKEADEILVARADFSDDITIGGYKPINDLSTDYHARGMTSLYDVVIEGSEKLVTYMNFLKNQGVRVKAVFSIFSDGEDTSSRQSLSDAKRAIEELKALEITTAFISFGGGATSVAKSLGFENILDVASSAGDLRKAFNCLSKSVIESSKTVVNQTDNFFNM